MTLRVHTLDDLYRECSSSSLESTTSASSTDSFVSFQRDCRFSFFFFLFSLRIFLLIFALIGVFLGPKNALDFDCFREYPTATSSLPSSTVSSSCVVYLFWSEDGLL